MFTGIVEALGRVVRRARAGEGWRLELRVPAELAGDLGGGHSVAVNGVCLTVVERDEGRLAFDLAEETLRVTTLGELAIGDSVNLERPLSLGARLGGHLVLGHVDGIGRVTAVEREGAGRRLGIEAPACLRSLLIPKGSVAVDGVSLTVASLEPAGFSVAVIPHTLAVTTLGERGLGSRVNLEMDVLGKYVHALLGADERVRESLARHGLGAPVTPPPAGGWGEGVGAVEGGSD